MSRISSSTGKFRRITANWAFDSTQPTGKHSERERRSELFLPRMTEQLEEHKLTEDSCNDCMSDGTDSGLGSATMLTGNQEVLEYMAENLMHFMNPTLVLPHLMNHGLLTKEDADYICSPKRSDELRKQRILCALTVQDGDVVERLVECLAGDSVYSNHRYIAKRLREAMETKKRHPDIPLSTLRLGTPSHENKESSPPSAPIKQRGAAQRNSIAKLLATKRNNVANLISQIETKEVSHQQQQKHPSLRPSLNFEPPLDKPGVHKMKVVQKEMRVPSNHPQSVPDSSATVHYAPPHPTFQPPFPQSPPQSTQTKMPQTLHHVHHYPLSPSRNHPHPLTTSPPPPSIVHTQPAPLSASSTDTSITHLYSPFSHPKPPPLSPNTPHPHISPPPLQFHSSSPHPTHSSSPLSYPTHIHVVHNQPPPTSPSTISSAPTIKPQFSPCVTSPPPRAPAHNLGASSDRASFNECHQEYEITSNALYGKCYSGLPTENGGDKPREREKMSMFESDKGSDVHQQKKSLNDHLSSLSPRKPTYTQSPSYTAKVNDELTPPEKFSPENDGDDSLQMDDMLPVRHRQRATRLTGLTARFYRHRRSASMSAYDTRPFKRGEQLYASENKGRMERSGFYHHRQGKEDDGTAKVRASVREGTEKLVKRRIDWLQERVQFTDCPEHIQFTSQTHYGEERELLYSGTLHKHGKPRFVVLFTDYLLILKARRPSVPSKLGGVFSFQQSTRIDWFSDLEYTAKKPLPLHLLTVQHKSSKQSNDNFCLHFNEKNKVMEIVLQAVSKEARDIWVEELSEAITQATSAHADTFVLVGNRALVKRSGKPYKKLQLQIHSASSLGLAANCNSFSLFCVIELGKQRCRTPSVMGGYNPSWEYKCEFTDFDDEDNLLLEIFSENIFRPNGTPEQNILTPSMLNIHECDILLLDFLGCLNVPLTSLPEEQSGRKKFDGNMVLAGLEEAFAGELHITVEQGWETKM